MQVQDYAAAKPWFERSLRLGPSDNPIAVEYLQIVTRKMLEAVTNAGKPPGGLMPRPAARTE